MTTLPIGQLGRAEVEVLGQMVEIRSLSRKETLRCGTELKDDPDATENYILMCGTGCTEDEAIAFRENTDPAEAGKLIDGIVVLSGMKLGGDGDPKGARLTKNGASPSSAEAPTPSSSL